MGGRPARIGGDVPKGSVKLWGSATVTTEQMQELKQNAVACGMTLNEYLTDLMTVKVHGVLCIGAEDGPDALQQEIDHIDNLMY